MKSKTYLGIFLAIALGLVSGACDNQGEKAQAPEQKQEMSAEAPAAAKNIVVAGKAKEVLNGGGFTYVLVNAGNKETWIAVPETEVAVGEEVKIGDGQMMYNFPSKTLDRTFAEVVFSSGLEGKDAKASSHGGMESASAASPHSPHGPMGGGEDFAAALATEAGSGAVNPGAQTMGSGKAIVPFQDLSIVKAEGGYNVGEIFAKATELNGKTVRVKGQVVKFSPNIMGKNWLHIQDGSGEPMNNTHDLVATTAAQVEKGDIVLVEGVLAAKKDFGFGYKYDVIVEDVKVSK